MNLSTKKILSTVFWTALLLLPTIVFAQDNFGDRASALNDITKQFAPLIKTGAIVVGIAIAAWGIYGFTQDDRSGGDGPGKNIIKVIVGGSLAAFSFLIDMASQTAMGEDSEAGDLLNQLEIMLPSSPSSELLFTLDKQAAT